MLRLAQREQRGVVDGVAPLGTVERDDERRPSVAAVVVDVPRHPYHAPDSMGADADDPIRHRRAQVARWTQLANRVGYLLLAGRHRAVLRRPGHGFSATMAGLVVAAMVAACVLLAPSIVLGYAVKAAERDDRERGSVGRVTIR